MLILCLTCLIICFIGFLVNKEITMYEFILNCVISLVVSLILFGFMLIPVPNDFNYMSGKMIKTSHYPAFVEEYEQQHTSTYACGTDSEGHTKYCTRVWYTTEHERHPEYWTKEDSLGQSWEIEPSEYDKLRIAFGNKGKTYNSGRSCRCSHGGHRVRGDNSVYYTNNDVNTYDFPTTSTQRWYNPLKRSRSIFNTEKNTVKYPVRYDAFKNDRMNCKPSKEWDILNTKLYERIGVNVILTTSAEDLKNVWMRGKRNDVIIQVDKIDNPTKVKVFGWYKSERLSAELETYILDHGINLNGIEHVILSYYQPFDFSEFSYLKYQLTDWQLLIISIVTIFVMIITYYVFSTNLDRR